MPSRTDDAAVYLPDRIDIPQRSFHDLVALEPDELTADEAAYLYFIAVRARTDFATFCFAVYPGYQFPHHIQSLCSLLNKAEHTYNSRVMVTCPPRHGKSQTCSILFPAWYIAKNPDKKLVMASYTGGLTWSFASQVRDILTGKAFKLIFPEIKVAGRARGSWGIQGHKGSMMATGVGSAMTGFGADFMIIDDPIRDAMYADSPSWREHLWDWYTSTAYTRLHPGAPLFLIACMTGDTPVLMADGSERPLRDIKVGDQVATYDNGQRGTSTVLNHVNNGPDKVYKIKMTSGTIVRANERHPFLVEYQGELKWTRLKDLSTGQRIVTLKDSGVNGRVKSAWLKAVRNLLFAGDTAIPTTKRRNGQTVPVLPVPLTRLKCGTGISSIAMASPVPSTIQCCKRRAAGALSAGNSQTAISLSGKMARSVWTTIMKLARCVGCYATTAIFPWGTSNPKGQHSNLWSTSDFTLDQIASIEPAGVEDVFDVHIERTENFIANGLVSHNTRWHHDDLSGRLLVNQKKDPDADQWEEIYFPAINNKNEALWPERYPLSRLNQIKATVGSRVWNALYQGSPTPEDGQLFKRWMFRKVLRSLPVDQKYKFVRYWDKAGTASGGDWTVGMLMAIDEEKRLYLIHMVRGQWSALEREQIIKATADSDAAKYSKLGSYLIGFEQEPGSGGKESAEGTTRRLIGYRVKADRPQGALETRADPYASYLEAGNGYMIAGEWIEEFVDEHCQFPIGQHDDTIAASAGAFFLLTGVRNFKYSLL